MGPTATRQNSMTKMWRAYRSDEHTEQTKEKDIPLEEHNNCLRRAYTNVCAERCNMGGMVEPKSTKQKCMKKMWRGKYRPSQRRAEAD